MAISDAPRCQKRKTNGEPCNQPAMKGQTCCQSHGGKSPRALKAAAERIKEMEAEKALAKYKLAGGRIEISNVDAMLWMVEEAAQNVIFYGDQVRQLRQGKGGKNAAGEFEEGLYSYIPEIGTIEHIWLKKYDAERDRLAKYASDCLKIGLEAKRVEIAEQQAQAFMQAQIASWDALGLTAEQRQLAANAIQGSLRKLRVIEGTG